tara:strand:+ start:62 stop:514 length:453 start_codon:yes stop_codon:yes gene_type:complete
MESFKQKRSNLLNDNPIAARAGGSWISKHSTAAGSPLQQGGSGKSPLYQDKKSGFQPNRGTVELDKTTRLTRDSQVLKDRESGEVVIGGGYDSDGKFIPRTAAQKKSATEEQLAVRKAKAKADTRSGAEKKAALEAKRKAKKAADLKSGK